MTDRVNLEEMSKTLMTIQDASKYLNVHTATLYRLLKKRQLPAFRIGKSWRLRVDLLDKQFILNTESESFAGV